jgi:iron complex transport system ATP-binding protein
MSGEPLMLKATGLTASIGKRRIIEDINLRVMHGEVVVIVGPNGAGKTTLLRAVAGLLPAKGEILVDGTPLDRLSLAERARRIAYLPQGHVFHWPLSVAEIVALGRLPRGRGADLSAADGQAVARALAATDTSEFAARSVTSLSGGERARVALARVLATEAPLILADEPTASLDPRYQLSVLAILQRHAKAGGAVVAVLHDLGLAARHADRIVVLDHGRIVEDGPPVKVLTRARLAETFGVHAGIVELAEGPVVIPWSVIGA